MAEDSVSKTGTKSKAWDYFGLQKGEDGKLFDDGCAICRTCCGRVKAKYDNTLNLLSHLKSHHPSLYQEAMKSGKAPRYKPLPLSQSTTQESVERIQKYE